MYSFIKKIVGAMIFAAMMLSIASCEDKSTEKQQKPTVEIEPGTVTENSLSFQITPLDADVVCYSVTLTSKQEPTVEDVLKDGHNADAKSSKTYTVDGIEPDTDYRIIAVASNEVGYSEPAVITMKTAEEEVDPVDPASVSLAAGEVTANSLSFTVSSANASKVAYVCVVKGATVPAAEEILLSGSSVEAGKTVSCTVNDLKAETEYVVVAAACDMNGSNPVSESLSMTTEANPVADPKVGDFYYSDGTWSTELDESKTPIGIVIFKGEATEYHDRVSFYKQKDGQAAMSKIHGYAIALKDATSIDGSNDEVWWSFFDGSYRGTCSSETNDFLGYTNTKSIIASAISRGGLTADNSSFPATYYAAVKYEETCPAPGTSSGWFLPSAYQFKYIWNIYFNEQGTMSAWIEKSFETLGDKAEPMYVRGSEYWTSTEKYDTEACSYWAYYFCFDSSMVDPGFIADYRKNAGMRVRSMLVF